MISINMSLTASLMVFPLAVAQVTHNLIIFILILVWTPGLLATETIITTAQESLHPGYWSLT